MLLTDASIAAGGGIEALLLGSCVQHASPHPFLALWTAGVPCSSLRADTRRVVRTASLMCDLMCRMPFFRNGPTDDYDAWDESEWAAVVGNHAAVVWLAERWGSPLPSWLQAQLDTFAAQCAHTTTSKLLLERHGVRTVGEGALVAPVTAWHSQRSTWNTFLNAVRKQRRAARDALHSVFYEDADTIMGFIP